MSGTKITRFLPDNEYKAAIGAASATATNVFATIADLATLGNGIYTGSGSLSAPTTVTMTPVNNLTFVGGNLKIKGLTDPNLFVANYSTDSVSMGNGTMRVSNLPISKINVNIASSNTSANGATVKMRNTSTSSSSTLTLERSNGGFAALYINTSSGSAIHIASGEIYGANTISGISLGSGFGFDASSRIESIIQGSYIEGYRASMYNTGNQTGFYAAGTSGSSTGGIQTGFSALNLTGTASLSVGFYASIAAQGNSSTIVSGVSIDWNGGGSGTTVTGIQKGFDLNMKTTNVANETVSGAIYGADFLLGTGSSSDVFGNITGHKITFNNTVGSTIAKAIGLEIDMGNSSTVATTSYAMTVLGGNSGFGVINPISMVTILGDVETTGNGNGLIVADSVTGTRYRILMTNGVLTTQLA